MFTLTAGRAIGIGIGWIAVVNLIGVLAFRRRMTINRGLPTDGQLSMGPVLLVWFGAVIIGIVALVLWYRQVHSRTLR